MAALLYVLTHSTDEPDRAQAALAAALAASRAGHDVALWLSGEGVRLAVEGVAETLREPGAETAAVVVAALVAADVPFHVERAAFTRRQYEADVLLPAARLADAADLAALLAAGRLAVTL